MSLNRTVELDGLSYEVEISYEFDGKYRPATMECPAEYPEFYFEVEHVKLEGMSIHSPALKKRIEDELYKIADALENEATEIMESRMADDRQSELEDW
jgi:hypothetical protein